MDATLTSTLAPILSLKGVTKSYTGKTGAAGVELTYNHVLSGKTGWELWTKTSSGYNQTRLKHSEAAQGSNVILSLDYRIQQATEAGLAKIKDPQGKLLPAAAVMLDVRTGEILALASQPTFDPNRLADRVSTAYYDEVDKSGAWLNRATQGLYSPGSTFKVITAIAGMRKKVVDWDDVLECGAFFRVGNRDFPEHEPVGFGDVDVEQPTTGYGMLDLRPEMLNSHQAAHGGVICTVIAYILFFKLLASAGATNLQLVTFLIPIVALFLGWWVLGEALDPHAYAGMAVIGLGLLLIDGRPLGWARRRLML